MADKTIGDLTAASSVAGADLFEIEQSGVSKKATATQLVDLLGGVSGTDLTDGNIITGDGSSAIQDSGVPITDMVTGTSLTSGNIITGDGSSAIQDSGVAVSDVVTGTSLTSGNIIIGDGSSGVQDSTVAISSFGALALEDSLDFSDLMGLVAFSQLDRTATIVDSETATLTITANTKIYSTASGTLTTIAFSGGDSAAQARKLILRVTGGPYTLTIPTCRRLGDTGSISALTVPNGEHELSWEYINSEYVLADSVPASNVTNTAGSLTSNAIVLGAGTNDSKVVAGIITDGTSQITLGVNTTTIGKVKLFGNTSGDVTIQPNAVAGTAVTVTLPATSTYVPISAQLLTFSGPSAARTITVPDADFTVARTDAANTFTGTNTIDVATQTPAANNTKAASTAYVDAAVGAVGSGVATWTGVAKVTGSNYTSSSATLTDVVVSSALSSSTWYEIEACIEMSRGADTSGGKFAIHSSVATAAEAYALVAGQTTATASANQPISAVDTATSNAFVTAVSGHGFVLVKGHVKTGSSGSPTISIQSNSVNGASGTTTIYIDSTLKWRLR